MLWMNCDSCVSRDKKVKVMGITKKILPTFLAGAIVISPLANSVEQSKTLWRQAPSLPYKVQEIYPTVYQNHVVVGVVFTWMKKGIESTSLKEWCSTTSKAKHGEMAHYCLNLAIIPCWRLWMAGCCHLVDLPWTQLACGTTVLMCLN